MENHAATDLGWLAFQYAIDELSPADALAFEQRLADDQQAREALAEATLLCQALKRTAPCTVPAQRGTLRPAASWTWAACGAAACLLVIGALEFLADDRPQPVATPVQPGRDEALAQAWFSARLPELENDPLALDLLAEEDVGLAGGEADSRLSVPVWMLEAVQDVPGTGADSQKES
jgi:hypothetical protein